jgi:hypothetical protein
MRNNRNGFAMVYGLIILLMITVCGTGIFFMMRKQQEASTNYRSSQAAVRAATASLEAFKGQLELAPDSCVAILKKFLSNSNYKWLLGSSSVANVEQFQQYNGQRFSVSIKSYDSVHAVIVVEGHGYDALGGRKIITASYHLDGLSNKIYQNLPPVPTIDTLPTLYGSCNVVAQKPTALDDHNGTITAFTQDPLFYTVQGVYTIHWIYDDGDGNLTLQLQTVIIKDSLAPVPAVNPLPLVSGTIPGGKCYTVKSYPFANDGCKGKIVATTISPLTYCSVGTYVIVWKYDDGNGNIITQNQTVIIQ